MKTIITIFFCGLYIVCFGQEKVILKNGKKIIIYPNKTWKYETEVKDSKIDSNAIILDLSDYQIWKHPCDFSLELKSFSKNDVELIGYTNNYFVVKSKTGQIGYVVSNDLSDVEDIDSLDIKMKKVDHYIKVLENRAVQKAKSERKKIIVKGLGVDNINSAGGVTIFIDWGYFDYSKDIKYISFTVVPYNNVGDVQTGNISGNSAITCQITGPISAGDSFDSDNYGVPYKWENVWYNSNITWIRLTKVVVQYMDGSSYVYVKELPKIMENKYINRGE